MIADVMLITAPMICYTVYKYFSILVALYKHQSNEIAVGVSKAPFKQNGQSGHLIITSIYGSSSSNIFTKLEANNCFYVLVNYNFPSLEQEALDLF